MPFTLSPTDASVIGEFPNQAASDYGIYISYDPESERWRITASRDRWIDGNIVISSNTSILEPHCPCFRRVDWACC